MDASTKPAVTTEPSTEEVLRSLEFDILFGRLRPRERLVEEQLMARFGAKRHVVRQVEEIAEIRETLQRQAAKRMRLPADKAFVARLEAAQRRHDKAVASRDPRAIDEANEAFHVIFFEACGNRHLSDAIAHYAYLSRAMRLYPMVEPELLETLRGEHWAMIEALRSGDRPALTRLVVDHIQHSKRIYLEARRAVGGAATD